MASKVTRTTVSGIELEIRREMNLPQNQRITKTAAAEQLYTQFMPRVHIVVRQHYMNMLKVIGATLLDPGFSGVRRAGSRQVSYRGPFGRSGHFRTAQWAALNPDYAAQNPRSTTFWRKGRGRSGRRNANNAVNYTQLAELYAAAVRSTRGPRRTNRPKADAIPTRPGRVELRTTFTFQRLPVPLNRILTASFIRGVERGVLTHRLRGNVGNRIRGSNINTVRDSIRRIAWPEATRPLVSGLAAKLGADMIQALKKLP